MSKLKVIGLVSAAGLSSRMGAFKPLLDFCGKPLICRTVESLLNGGAEQVIVVTGRNSEQIQEALRIYPQVKTVQNPEYAQSAMYDSIRIGLEQMEQCDAIVFLPADVPAVKPETIQDLLRCWMVQRPDVLYPVYAEKRWHPPVIAGRLLPELIGYNGEKGLKGALEQLSRSADTKQVFDRGCTMDADYKEDYDNLCRYWPVRDIPDDAICEMLYKAAETPEAVKLHSRAVAKRAMELADVLLNQGIALNRDLLYRAALLHDVCRTSRNHAETGAAFLCAHGFYRIADIIRCHMDWPDEKLVQLNEASILYLADKLVSGDQDVTLKQRFAQKAEQYAGNPEAAEQIHKRCKTALAIQTMIESVMEETCMSDRTEAGKP